MCRRPRARVCAAQTLVDIEYTQYCYRLFVVSNSVICNIQMMLEHLGRITNVCATQQRSTNICFVRVSSIPADASSICSRNFLYHCACVCCSCQNLGRGHCPALFSSDIVCTQPLVNRQHTRKHLFVVLNLHPLFFFVASISLPICK